MMSSVADADPKLESCRQVLEQAEYLLEDEIRYSGTLRASRNTVSTLLLIVVGIGLFQMDLFGGSSDTLRVELWALWTIRALMSGATALVLLGVYWLYTERPRQRKHDEEIASNPILRPQPFQSGNATAALAVLHVNRDLRERMETRDEAYAVRIRTRILGIAYERLVAKNRRVRYRIEVGRRWLFSGVVVLFSAFLVYLWGLKVETSGDAHGEQRNAQHDAAAPGE